MDEQLSFNLDIQTAKAVENVDALLTAIDDLTKGLDDNFGSGSEVVKTFGSLTKEADSLSTSISDLVKVMADNTKATEDNTLATDDNIKATEDAIAATGKEVAELRSLIVALKETAAANRDAAVAEEERATATKTATTTTTESKGILESLSGVGTPAILKAATWGALAVGGVAYEAIKHYSSFNAILMQSITQAGRAPSSLPFLTSDAVSIAKQTGASLNDVANMMYRVSSATANWNDGMGASNKQLAQMTKQVANLNVLGGVAGGAPAEQSARIMGAMMNANLPGTGHSAAGVAALVNAAVGGGDIKQSEFISAMGRGLLASLSAHHISASSGASFVDLLTTLGTPGSTAGQYAKTALTLMTAPSAQGSSGLAMLGINTGQLGTLLSQKNGITAAAEYMHQAVQKFNPYAYNVVTTEKTASGSSVVLNGKAAAVYQLEKWATGQIPQSVINAWSANKLKGMTAAELGTTKSGAHGTAISGAQWLNTLQNLIITKSFGGSRSSATLDALINNPAMIAGIQSYIDAHSNVATYNKDLKLALNTPQAQMHRMEQSVMGSLVTIGQELTPTALKLAHGLTDIVTGLSKLKWVLIPLVSLIASAGAVALVSKTATLIGGGIKGVGDLSKVSHTFWGGLAGKTEKGSFFNKLFGGLGSGSMLSGKSTVEIGLLEEIATNTKVASMGSGVGGTIEKLLGGKGGPTLSEAEKSVLKGGSTVTKSAVRDAMVARGEVGSYAESMTGEGLAKVTASFDKLTKIQSGALKGVGAAANAVESAAPEVAGIAERVGFGGLAESALGIAGGPVGMIAMATLGPILLPLITKGLGGIFSHLFSSPAIVPKVVSAGGKVTLTPNQLKTDILSGQAELPNLYKAIAKGGPGAAAAASKYYNLEQQIKGWQGLLPHASVAKAAKANNAAIALHEKQAAAENAFLNYLTPPGTGRTRPINSLSDLKKMPGFRELPANVKTSLLKEFRPLYTNIGGIGKTTKIVNPLAVLADLRGDIKAQHHALMHYPQYAAQTNAKAIGDAQKSSVALSQKQWAESKKNNLGAKAVPLYVAFEAASLRAATDASADKAAAKLAKSLGESKAASSYEKLADVFSAKSRADAAAATGIKNKNNLSTRDLEGITKAVANGFLAGQPAMQSAFSAALGNKGLSGAVSAVLAGALTGKGK